MLLVVLVFVCLELTLAQSLEKRQDDGSTPKYPVSPSTIKSCNYWVNVDPGYTCGSIESYYNLSPQLFLAWNPSLKSDCSGLEVDHSYCIGIDTATTTTSTSATGTTHHASKTVTGSPKPSPTQPGLIKKCTAFYKVKPHDTCSGIVAEYGTFTLHDFYSWNPAIGNDCKHLLYGFYVCVGVPGTPTVKPSKTTIPHTSGPQPEQTGIIHGCKRYHKVVAGDTCEKIVSEYGTFSLPEFYKWNPAVGSSCKLLIKGYYVCVGIAGTPTKPTMKHKPNPPQPTHACPLPQQAGTIKTCKKCYKVKHGDTSAQLEKTFGISAAEFRKWNPKVNQACTNLELGYHICIGV